MPHNSNRWLDLLGLATLAFLIVGLYMAFLYAQTEVNMGLVYRIFFFHMGAIAAGLLSVIFVGIASIAYLRTSSRAWDRFAEASTEVGIVFSVTGLIMGSIWARPVWLVWWTWDPRLTSFFLLCMYYIAYLMLRASGRDDVRVARFSAVYGIIGVLWVPLVILSVRIWRGISPVLFQENAQGFTFSLTTEMTQTLGVCIIAVLLLFIYLLILRIRLESLRDELVVIRREYQVSGGTYGKRSD